MDEDEYDPFAEEYVDTDMTPSWTLSDNVIDEGKIVPTSTLPSSPATRGEKRKANGLDEETPAEKNELDSSLIKADDDTLTCDDTENRGPLRENRLAVESDSDKILWKSCWAYIKKFLRPYTDDGRIATKTDCDRLSRKLAQKVYEKEKVRGTTVLNRDNAVRARKYVEDYFTRHAKYSPSKERRVA